MSIEIADPPRPVERFSYEQIMEAVKAADGKWIKLGFDEVAGEPTPAKQTRLWHAAKSRGLRVTTTIQDGALYVRLRKEPQ